MMILGSSHLGPYLGGQGTAPSCPWGLHPAPQAVEDLDPNLSHRTATSIGGSSSCKLVPLHRSALSFVMKLSSKVDTG